MNESAKLALSILFLIAVTSTGAAWDASNYDFTWQDSSGDDISSYSMTYSDINNQVIFECYTDPTSSFSCHDISKNEIIFEISGVENLAQNIDPGTNTKDFELYIDAPKIMSVSPGGHKLIAKKRSSGQVIKELPLSINAKDMQPDPYYDKIVGPHAGKYMFIELDASHDMVRDVILTNDKTGFTGMSDNSLDPSDVDKGDILLQETDWGTADGADDFGILKLSTSDLTAQPATLIDELTGSSLKDNVDGDVYNFKTDNNGAVNNDGVGAEGVYRYDFTTSISSIGENEGEGCDSYHNDFESCTGIHDGDNYIPEGELILSYNAKQDVSAKSTIYPEDIGGDGPYWHICREGNLGPSGTGKVVDINPNEAGGLYKCDTGQWFDWKVDVAAQSELGEGNWVPVHECVDDIDNDINIFYEEKADADGSPPTSSRYSSIFSTEAPSDPKCANRYNVNWETQAACTEGETNITTRKVKVGTDPTTGLPVYEDRKYFQKCMESDLTSGDSVAWHEHLHWEEDGFEEHFPDSKTGWYNDWSLAGEGGNDTFLDETDGFIPSSNTPNQADKISLPGTWPYEISSDAPYHVSFPETSRFTYEWVSIFNGTLNGNEVMWGLGWMPEGGWSNYDVSAHVQTLSEAKEGYFGDSSASMCSGEGSAGADYLRGVNCSDNPPYGWISTNMNQSEYGDKIDWEAMDYYDYGPYIDVDTLVNNESQPENKEVWTGGWVPHCEANATFTYSLGEWRCESSSGFGTMNVNFYNHSQETGGITTGFQINESELEKWKKAHPHITSLDGSDDGILPLTVRAECWQGNASNRPSSDSDKVFLEAQYSSGDMVVAGTLPERDVPNPGQYSCVYGVQQIVYPADEKCTASATYCDSAYIPSDNTTLYYQGSEGTRTAYIYDGEATFGYITEGTDTEGYVATTNTVINAPGQSMLQNQNNATQWSGTDPWYHFFPGGPTTGEYPRHPGEEYCNQLFTGAPGC